MDSRRWARWTRWTWWTIWYGWSPQYLEIFVVRAVWSDVSTIVGCIFDIIGSIRSIVIGICTSVIRVGDILIEWRWWESRPKLVNKPWQTIISAGWRKIKISSCEKRDLRVGDMVMVELSEVKKGISAWKEFEVRKAWIQHETTLYIEKYLRGPTRSRAHP